MAPADLDQVIDAYHEGIRGFLNGDTGPILSVFSERDDVTLANPLGPARRGRTEVERATVEAASTFKGGSIEFEEVSRYSTSEVAYVHDIQRTEVQTVGGEGTVRISLRVTTIFRREGDTWKVALRHADPLTGPRPLSAIIET